MRKDWKKIKIYSSIWAHCITLIGMNIFFSRTFHIRFHSKSTKNMAYQNVITLKIYIQINPTCWFFFRYIFFFFNSIICILSHSTQRAAACLWCAPHSFHIATWTKQATSLCSITILDYLFIAWSSTVHFGVRIVKYFGI